MQSILWWRGMVVTALELLFLFPETRYFIQKNSPPLKMVKSQGYNYILPIIIIYIIFFNVKQIT
jgi:hypothetical protein